LRFEYLIFILTYEEKEAHVVHGAPLYFIRWNNSWNSYRGLTPRVRITTLIGAFLFIYLFVVQHKWVANPSCTKEWNNIM
jgi:hypothetical protein